MQNIFGVQPYLGDAANGRDLSDLFIVTNSPGIRLLGPRVRSGSFGFVITNVTVGKTLHVQASSNLKDWVSVKTNVPTSTSVGFTERLTNLNSYFYRVRQAP